MLAASSENDTNKENFLEFTMQLYDSGTQPIVFVGPEERNLLGYFQNALRRSVPVIFEPEPQGFAALVANCNLFVTCDSGPLACALSVRTVAIFPKREFRSAPCCGARLFSYAAAPASYLRSDGFWQATGPARPGISSCTTSSTGALPATRCAISESSGNCARR